LVCREKPGEGSDRDGDGKTDPAVCLPAEAALQAGEGGNPSINSGPGGKWQVLLSGSGYGIATATFGGEGYDPVGLRPE
jgi:hypothetical protein